VTDVFDEVAELYDAIRPGYPDAVGDAIDAVISRDATILEIGMGTGQATVMLARRGYRVIGLEPGARLAALAAKNLSDYPSVTIEKSKFEAWPITPGLFDLVFSATAFHWVAPEVRYVKTAQALAKGGHLALLWNITADESFEESGGIQSAYERCLPQGESTRRTVQERTQSWTDAIAQSGLYGESIVLQFPWSKWYSTERYLMLLDKYSDHRPLPEETKRCLYGGIAEVLEANGGGLHKRNVAVLILARKRREDQGPPPAQSATRRGGNPDLGPSGMLAS
jgi:SAM-dependent methyltransferase